MLAAASVHVPIDIYCSLIIMILFLSFKERLRIATSFLPDFRDAVATRHFRHAAFRQLPSFLSRMLIWKR
jgi:hypothetical protein